MSGLQSYVYETEPFEHQRRVLEASYDREAFAILWEQGTGKTKAAIDTAARLYQEGKINALLVVAPNGVHRNWVTDELPVHLPKSIDARIEFWQTPKAGQKVHKLKMHLLGKHEGLKILCMSYPGFMTTAAMNYAAKFLKENDCLMILDEAHHVKNPRAKRTKTVLKAGLHAKYKRILTGTPGDKPFDLYSQFQFLNKSIWKDVGFSSYHAFKNHFGVWQKMHGPHGQFDVLRAYKNLDDLHPITAQHSDRVLKEDVLDLPAKLYKRMPFEMTPRQRKYYNELRDTLELELDTGEYVDGSLALVKLLRLQQITCGYIQASPDLPAVDIDGKNPRLEACVETFKDLPHQAIIWARFSRDIDLITDALGKSAVRYDGRITDDEANYNKLAFQNGDRQFFVANPAKGSEGITLVGAKTVGFYSNSFKLLSRLQAEDRCHRIGQDTSVLYIDFFAPDTVDEKIIDSLRAKYDVAATMNGDKLREWIT